MDAIRVALVDDSEEFLMGASSWIRSEPALTLAGTSRSGEEVLDLTERLEIDLVLMDAVMPGMNGFETTRRLKSRPRPPFVVILTFHDTQAAREAARAAGADGFLSKPEFPDRLMPVIRSLFDEAPARGTDPAVLKATQAEGPAMMGERRSPGATRQPDSSSPNRTWKKAGGDRGD